MTKGYVLISRGLLKHPRFKPSGPLTQFEAWYWLIEAAAYAPRDVPVMCGRRTDVIILAPGQLTHSIRFLAKAWGWGDKRVQRFLNVLKADGSIATKPASEATTQTATQTGTPATTQTTTAQTVITLCNWAKYQRPDFDATTQTTTQRTEGATTQTTTKKKEIKEKKDIALSEKSFSDWYSIYPRKKSREAAKRAYARIIASGDISESHLFAKTQAFANIWASESPERRKFIPYPASWLNAGSYHDEPDGIVAGAGPVARDARSFTDADWQKRLTYFHDSRTWLEAWGAKPGDPGCLVPPHLIVTPVSSAKGAA
jgi:hypothetical protein